MLATRRSSRASICETALTLCDGHIRVGGAKKEKLEAAIIPKTRARNKRAEDKAMTVILVLAMFVTFLVVGRFTNKKAPKYVLQTAPRTEAGEANAQPIVAGYEVPEH